MRHGGPRAPLGPGVLRRRGPSAGGRTATGGFSQRRQLGVGQLSPRAAHRRAHGFDARFPDPGVLTSAARRALGPKAAASLRSVLRRSGLEAGPESSSVEGERRAVREVEGRREEDQWRAGLEAGSTGRSVKGCGAGLGRDLREDSRGLEEGWGRSSRDPPSGSNKGPVRARSHLQHFWHSLSQ